MKCGSLLIKKLLLICISHLLIITTVDAKQIHSIEPLDNIKSRVNQYIAKKINSSNISTNDIKISIGNLDPRLRLQKCKGDLVTFTPPGSQLSGNTTVGVRCDSPKRWSIYISVHIAIYKNALVFTRKMKKGEIIERSDLRLGKVDTSKVRGHSFNKIDDVIGNKLKRRVNAEQAIDSTIVCLICKGDSVIISSGNRSISVTMAGTALNDGSKGDKIRVQNNASRLVLDAIIDTNNSVIVDI